MAENVKITLVKSPIGIIPKHKAVLDALGLKKIHQTKTFVNNDTLKGQVALVSYLLKVEKEG